MRVSVLGIIFIGLLTASCREPSSEQINPIQAGSSPTPDTQISDVQVKDFAASQIRKKDLSPLSDPLPQRVELPQGLFEISGLAMASDKTVYAHDDEYGIIYEVDISTGETGSIFALGDPTIRADFEGIAVHGDNIYMITSDGVLYETRIGAHQQRVQYNRYETGIGALCEVEGLAIKTTTFTELYNDPNFLILCKTPRQKYYQDRLTIFKWTFETRLAEPAPFLSLDRDLILTPKEQKRFNPSAIEWDAENQSIFVISARNGQVVHLSEAGELLSKHVLDTDIHPQSEGLTLMPNGDWIIADEGQEANPGLLTHYRASP